MKRILLLVVAGCGENPAECGIDMAASVAITLHHLTESLVPTDSGAVGRTLPCLVQGSARIDGTITSDGRLLGATTFALRFDLSDCRDDSLTFNGLLVEQRDTDLLTDDDVISANALTIRGECIACDGPIDAVCAVSYSSTSGSGQVCGKSFP